MANINFLSENIDIKKIMPAASKIEKMVVNPISYHTTVMVEGKPHSFELKVMRMPEGGFTVIINDPNVHGTIACPLSVLHSELNSALKAVLTNWEKILSERQF